MAKSWWYLAGKTFYNLTRWWPRKQNKKVPIDPLPEQIQAFYRENPMGRTGPYIKRDTDKDGVPRILLFFDLLPEEEALPRGISYVDVWRKYGDNWVLTTSGLCS